MKKTTLVVLICSLLIVTLGFPFGAFATTEDDLEDVREQEEEAKTEKAMMMEELEVKQAALDEINANIEVLQGEINAKQEEIYDIQARIVEMRESIAEQKGSLGNRLRNMYKSGSVGAFDVLLDSNNFSDFLSNLNMVQRIYDSDQKTLEELEVKHANLEAALKDLEEAKAALDAAMAEMETQQAIAEEAKAEVEALIAEIEARIAEYEAEAARLEAIIIEEQEALRRQMEAAAAAAAAGTSSGDAYADEIYQNFSASSDSGFIWPASGPLTSYFGYRSAASTSGVGSTNHGGIDIGIGMYTVVRASKSGYVSSATGWSGGYGYAVYLNHDNGYSTVYGHNSEILVSPGQYVEQGQAIAYSGSTGWSTGPHLHFEVRINGVQYDPLAFLP